MAGDDGRAYGRFIGRVYETGRGAFPVDRALDRGKKLRVGANVRASSFDAIELDLGALWA